MSGQAQIESIAGRGLPVPGNDIDTDRIIPARYLKVITFEGLGEFAFYDERFNADGSTKPHPFNDERFRGAEVLLVNRNFGCGSSREHAPQALMRSGIKAVVGESFAEIFAGNCTAMGVPSVTASHQTIAALMEMVERDPRLTIAIDLQQQRLTAGDFEAEIRMPGAFRNALVAGTWNSTAAMLAHRPQIEQTVARLPYLNDFAVAAGGKR